MRSLVAPAAASFLLATTVGVASAFAPIGPSSSAGRSVTTLRSTVSTEESTKSRTQRIMEKTSSSGQAGGAGGLSTWDAFLRTEANWQRLKESKEFKYDPRLLRKNQNGIPPPMQFVVDDGAYGSPRAWAKLREQADKAIDGKPELDYDVTVCGGTLGIFVALALQLKGHDVLCVEAGPLRGREQEWNISMDEMLELVDLGVLTQEDIDEAVQTEFPACRSGFKNREKTPLKGTYFENDIGYETTTPDVLNLGVAPSILIENVKQRFIALGGTVKEMQPL